MHTAGKRCGGTPIRIQVTDTEAAAVSFQHVQAAFLALRKNDAESCKENAFDSERRERRRKACAKVDWAKMREDSQSETSRNSTPVGERN